MVDRPDARTHEQEEGRRYALTRICALLVVCCMSSLVVRYVACPQESCRGKKVQAGDDDQFFCDKCGGVTRTPNYRYLLSVVLQDETGSIWLSCFDREGEKLLGVAAADLHRMRDEEPATYQECFQRAANRDWTFGIKVNEEDTWEGARREHQLPLCAVGRAALASSTHPRPPLICPAACCWSPLLQAASKSDPLQSSQYDLGPRFQACSAVPVGYVRDTAELAQFIERMEAHETQMQAQGQAMQVTA